MIRFQRICIDTYNEKAVKMDSKAKKGLKQLYKGNGELLVSSYSQAVRQIQSQTLLLLLIFLSLTCSRILTQMFYCVRELQPNKWKALRHPTKDFSSLLKTLSPNRNCNSINHLMAFNRHFEFSTIQWCCVTNFKRVFLTTNGVVEFDLQNISSKKKMRNCILLKVCDRFNQFKITHQYF